MVFEEEAARLIKKHVEISLPEIMSLLEIPPDPKLGDLAFPCFSLARIKKQAPAKIALELAEKIKPEMPFDTIISEGPYLNFFFDSELFAKKILNDKLIIPKRKEKVMVEHSNGNTHKEVHVGHLRNLFIGDSLVRILRAGGFSVVNTYYINDTGMHVAKCLWALKKFHDGEKPPKNSELKWLGSIYAEGARKTAENPSFKKEADVILQRLEKGDPEITTLWKKTRQWSIDNWHRIFDELKMLTFDARFYDSEITPLVKPIVDDMLRRGFIKESEGALIADLEKYGLGIVIIRKSDGTTPYIAKDLALAKKKFEDYNIDKSVYVVASEQELHFKQLFKLLDLYGFRQAKNCYHFSYGLVMLSSGKISSREGRAPLYEDFSKQLFNHSLEEVIKRHPDWSEKKQRETAWNISLAAMKFPMIVHEPLKNIIFDVEKALDFNGETGPYLQYSYARLSSILRKYGKKIIQNIDYSLLSTPEDLNIIRLLSKQQEIILSAAEKYRPALVARYALELSQNINNYYQQHRILGINDENLMKARLLLIFKVRNVLGNLLELLGIPIVEEM